MTASMMSDEEEIDEKFSPEWRSTEFNEFMSTLDCRANINNTIHPRRDGFFFGSLMLQLENG